MSNTALTDWLTFVPAGEARKQKAYIDLPAFSYASQGTVGDASVIVAQFNFSASRDFYLLPRPTKPANVTYGLCIRYRIGETVYRYKLWEDNAFVLSSATLSYAKQLIKKNFVLEVWNFAGVASVNAAAIRMVTSVRNMPTDYRSIAHYALAVGAEFTDLANNNVLTLPASVTDRWTASSLYDGNDVNDTTPWNPVVGSQVLSQSDGAKAPIKVAANSIYSQGYVSFADGVAKNLNTTFPSGLWQNYTLNMVGNIQIAVSPSRYFWNIIQGVAKTWYSAFTATVTEQFGDLVNSSPLTYQQSGGQIAAVYKFVVDTTGAVQIQHQFNDDAVSYAVATSGGVFAAKLNIVDSLIGADAGEIRIADIVLLRNKVATADEDTQIKQYLRNLHFGEIPLPMTFSVGGPWLDNTP